jgi:AcrR family transcriptional regulator
LRAQILQQATRLFAARGFDGTSVQEIAEAVGIRKPSLLYHFASKDELHQAVLDQVLARWSDVMPRLLMAAAQDERFDAVMEDLISFFRADPDRARLLVREVLDRPEHMTARFSEYVEPWLEVIVGQLERGKAQGLMHPDLDAEAYVVQVINLVVCGMATAAPLQTLLPGSSSAEQGWQRHVREMLRVARASLFVEQRPAAARPAR